MLGIEVLSQQISLNRSLVKEMLSGMHLLQPTEAGATVLGSARLESECQAIADVKIIIAFLSLVVFSCEIRPTEENKRCSIL